MSNSFFTKLVPFCWYIFTYSVLHLIRNGEDVSKNLLSGFSIKHASGNTIHDKGIGNILSKTKIIDELTTEFLEDL